MTPLRARAEQVANQFERRATFNADGHIHYKSICELTTAIESCLRNVVEECAKVADARALRKPERFELGLTHNERCGEADVIAAAIRRLKEEG